MPELYQVVKNPAPPGSGGIPIFCSETTAWLGKGVYFWESFIENARQYGNAHCSEWGKANGTKGFSIYKAVVVFGDRCLNLVDNVNDLRDVRDFYEKLESKNIKGRPIRVYELLRLMRKNK